jgi:CTP synthase
LPGGQDLEQVPAQIKFAEYVLNHGIPTLGLCLGMQSMTTAAIRASLWCDAMLEEAAGPGPHRSFVRMQLEDGSTRHRAGDHEFRPAPGTRLEAILPLGATIRMNHRYCFNRDIGVGHLPQFALHWTGDVLDAIEAKTHPFYIGLQGHPELGTDPALLGVWTAFVEAAIKSHHVRTPE